jgi:hypothetical protein
LQANEAARAARLRVLNAELAAHGLPSFASLDLKQRDIMFACGDFGKVLHNFQAIVLLSDATIQLAVATLVRMLVFF